jgi:hypothetical protein
MKLLKRVAADLSESQSDFGENNLCFHFLPER